jgi:hypothetical protein
MWQLIDSETTEILEETDSFSYLMKRFHDLTDEGRLVHRHFEFDTNKWMWWTIGKKAV